MARVKPLIKVQEKKLQRAENVAEMLRHAAQISLDNPLRQGAIIQLPLQGEVVVGADIHGNRKNFQAIVHFAKLEENPLRHLVFLGDIIHSLESLQTGKDFSCLLLEELVALKIRFPKQVHLLLGNHELSELLGRQIFKDGKYLNYFFQKGLVATYGEKGSHLVRQAFNYFVQNLPVVAKTQTKIVISHSTPEVSFLNRIRLDFFQQSLCYKNQRHIKKVEEVVWGRDFSQDTANQLARQWESEIFIVGHEKCEEGYSIPNSYHIILDSTDDYGTVVLFKLHQPYAQRGVVRQIRYLTQLSADPLVEPDRIADE